MIYCWLIATNTTSALSTDASECIILPLEPHAWSIISDVKIRAIVIFIIPSQDDIEIKKKKYCRFKKNKIKYVDYKDPEFLKKFLNEQGRILPRRITGTSLKYQRKVAKAVKRSRHLAMLPYLTDMLK